MLLLMSAGASAQQSSLTLTFSATNNTDWVRLDSTRITNRTRNWDTVLVYPDTVLVLNYLVGLPDHEDRDGNFMVFQNYPNPAARETTVVLFIPSKDKVEINVADVNGKVKYRKEFDLPEGFHEFRFLTGSQGIYFFNARWRDYGKCIRIIATGALNLQGSAVEYLGYRPSSGQQPALKHELALTFSLGDELRYTGYSEGKLSGILDAPQENEAYTFQFATNIPCPGTPTVEYEGQVYNTIQVFSQCWLKENLNAGVMIDGTGNMSNDGVIEKYCYNNQPDSCAKHGGLYQWDEMMQYTTDEINRGICPPGWHLPSDEEWKLLEGAADSQYGIGDPVWDNLGWRGEDAGFRLRKEYGWNCPGTDEFGFGSWPTGMREEIGIHNSQWFHSFGSSGYYWSTTQNTGNTSKIYHYLPCIIDGAGQGIWSVPAGMSVRCLK